MISFACPFCRHSVKCPDSFAGGRGRCPSCKQKVDVPVASTLAGEAPANLPVEVPVRPIVIVEQSYPPADYRACPFCGEQILSVAKKCKHCNEIIDVSLRQMMAAAAAAQPIAEPDTKPCDFCGERIQLVARKCRYCGEVLDPELRAASEAKARKRERKREQAPSINVYNTATATQTSSCLHGCLALVVALAVVWILFAVLL